MCKEPWPWWRRGGKFEGDSKDFIYRQSGQDASELRRYGSTGMNSLRVHRIMADQLDGGEYGNSIAPAM